jgi:flavin reductase (DIM6/NTAB) family NADH-FMN oxidoreductase RutF
MLSFNPAECQQRQIYKLMTGIIVPRPVALVSTMSRDGVANLAPFSFFCGVGSAPPTVLFCPALRPSDSDTPEAGQRKDTLRNVEETGEFVINVVSEEIAAAANASSAEVPFEVDEFVLSGLTPIRQRSRPPAARRPVARADGVQAPPGHLHRPRAGQRRHRAGRGGALSCARGSLRGLSRRSGGLDAVGRMAGNTWVRTRDRIELIRPK